MKKVTVCVLLYGDYLHLAKRCLNSIIDKCPRDMYELRVGCNEVGLETLTYVMSLAYEGFVDSVYVSTENINKCPMMRRMYKDVSTDWIWWFDDDSYITEADAMERWLERIAADSTQAQPPVLYGKVFFFGSPRDFDYGLDIVSWIKNQRWYRGHPVPCGVDKLDPSFNTDGKNTQFFFVTGGVHLINTEFVNMLGWPTPTLVKRNDDVILCCAIRQNGYSFVDLDYGVEINQHERRGNGEDEKTMKEQLGVG